jgi:hypothetical protein
MNYLRIIQVTIVILIYIRSAEWLTEHPIPAISIILKTRDSLLN